MAAEFSLNSLVVMFISILFWDPVVGETLVCSREVTNEMDRLQ